MMFTNAAQSSSPVRFQLCFALNNAVAILSDPV